ncbi:hypothetical protein Tco_1100261 [Tanacetum coccineum]
MYPRFLQFFLNNQLKDLPKPFNDTYETPTHSKKVFSNMARKSKNFSRKVTPLFDSMLVQNQAPKGEDHGVDKAIHKDGGDGIERAITTDASLVAAQDSDNILKTQSIAMFNDPLSQEISSGDRPKCQDTTLGGADAQTRPKTESKISRDPPLSEVNISRRGEDSMEYHDDLTDFVPPTPHDSPLSGEEAKIAQDRVITRLKLRVKRLEIKRKARTPHSMKRRLFKGIVETSSDKSLVIVEDKGSGEKGSSTADQVSTDRPEVSAASVPVNVSATTPSTPPTTTTIFADEDLTIAQTLMKMRSEKAKEKEKGVVLIDEEEPPRLNRSTTTLQPLLTIDLKDKGKGVLVEEEPEKLVKVRRKDQGLAQIESDAELAQRLHKEELAELDRAQKERQKQEEAISAALAEEFDEIQARIDDDHELAVRLTHKEQEKYTTEERARLLAEFFERRKKQLAAERAEAIRNKPPIRTQVRNRVITYLKHIGK